MSMTVSATHVASNDRSEGGVLQAIVGFFVRINQRMQLASELRNLTERELSDIGINRYEAEQIIRGLPVNRD